LRASRLAALPPPPPPPNSEGSEGRLSAIVLVVVLDARGEDLGSAVVVVVEEDLVEVEEEKEEEEGNAATTMPTFRWVLDRKQLAAAVAAGCCLCLISGELDGIVLVVKLSITRLGVAIEKPRQREERRVGETQREKRSELWLRKRESERKKRKSSQQKISFFFENLQINARCA